jgi:hypothetical protein
MYIYLYVYIYIYVHVCMYVCVYIFIFLISIYIHIWLYLSCFYNIVLYPNYYISVEHDTLMSEVMSEAITLGEMTDEIDSSDLELIFNGVRLYPHQMVSMLKMEDGDVIHCVLQNNAYINVVDKDRYKMYDTAP